MSRVMVAPGKWADEGPRPGFLTGIHVHGEPIVTRGTSHTAVRSAAGQREYRERRRAAYHAKAEGMG